MIKSLVRNPLPLIVVVALTLTGGVVLAAGPTARGTATNPLVEPTEARPPAISTTSVAPPRTTKAATRPPSTSSTRPPARPTKKSTKAVAKAPSRPAPAKTPRTYRLSPVTALGSQAAIDRGNLVTWMTSPACLLAGHDTMGWAWLDNIPTGSIAVVTRGPCAGRYKVVGHRWQSVKGGPIPSWVGRYDLVLQTCTGRTGTGFSVAVRLS